MSFYNYKWAWHLRGLSCSEQLVCLFLAEVADVNGRIDRLKHSTIAKKLPGIGQRRVREIIALLHQKKFIVDRKARFSKRGDRISNGYQIDLSRFHPPDEVGERLWKQTLAMLRAQEPKSLEAIKIYSLDSSAYYSDPDNTLSVWLDSPRAYMFFEVRTPSMLAASQLYTPKITRYELICPSKRDTD